MEPLSLWLSARSPEQPFALRAEGCVSRARFEADVAALRAVLAGRPRGRWLVGCDGAYAAAVALFATWHAGSTAVLPPNLEPGVLGELAPGAQGILCDRPLAAPFEHARLAVLGHPAAPPPRWDELARDLPLLELCTSGSTGARKRVAKSLSQLEAEIEELESTFGARCGRATVLGTVSHQHVYGLLFRVLWPMSAGRVFDERARVDPGELLSAVLSAGESVLVGSPAHLARLPELLEIAKLRGAFRIVFSSGGPLDASTARRWSRELGFAPCEVLGSTETGGIAWREQSERDPDDAWTPFPSAVVEARDGLLHVRSPQSDLEQGITTGDAVELAAGGRFFLRGRADRIVKLFDERVSLCEVEARLSADPALAAAAALTIERHGTQRIAVAAVPSELGAAIARDQGKPALVARLQAVLEPYFRPPALPRAWRFVTELPADAQGKRSIDALRALFELPAESRGPHLVAKAVENERELEVELEVPPDLWCFRGHFEGFPVVPGVVQLQWVVDWLGVWSGVTPRVGGIDVLKFKHVMRAGERVRLRLERNAGDARVRFRMWNAKAEFSSGRLELAEEGK